MNSDRPRRPNSARDKAEALFKPAAPKAPTPADKRPSVPGAKELVSLRIDRSVLDHFKVADQAGRIASTTRCGRPRASVAMKRSRPTN